MTVAALVTKPPDLKARCQKANSNTSSLAWKFRPTRGEKLSQVPEVGPKVTVPGPTG